jgi:hypothetical protein
MLEILNIKRYIGMRRKGTMTMVSITPLNWILILPSCSGYKQVSEDHNHFCFTRWLILVEISRLYLHLTLHEVQDIISGRWL